MEESRSPACATPNIGGHTNVTQWQEKTTPTVAQWQHAWITVNPNERDDTAKLEQMGNEGWELVSVIQWGQASVFLMFFKRPKSV
jgi:hypothetical protein